MRARVLALIVTAIVLAAGGGFVVGRTTDSDRTTGPCKPYPGGSEICPKRAVPESPTCFPNSDLAGGMVLWTGCDPEAERRAAEAARRAKRAAERAQEEGNRLARARLQAKAKAQGFRTVLAMVNYESCIRYRTYPERAYCDKKWKGK